MVGIDREVEQAARTLLVQAIRRELDDQAASMRSAGNETLRRILPLCLAACAYIAIDVSERWPTEADLHEIAKHAAQSVTRLDISEQEIYDYLSRVAFGSERLDEVFSAEGIVPIPLYTTANLLLKFRPEDKEWWEYLDEIWDAAETAERTPLTVLPALMLRARKHPGPPDDD
jgi:hypothetical protein